MRPWRISKAAIPWKSKNRQDEIGTAHRQHNKTAMSITRWLREPLVHFLVLGALIFLAYGLLSDQSDAPQEIRIGLDRQENLARTFARTWQRPPDANEFEGLIKDFLRQEIAYREARKMGLDEDDIVIRRRLRQKLELLAEDVVSLSPPGEDELRDWYGQHTEDFMNEPRIGFRQVYFGIDDGPEVARSRAEALLPRLNDASARIDFVEAGDPSLLPIEFRRARQSEVASSFGIDFAAEVAELPTGRWSGPVSSPYGLHLVFVTASEPAARPAFEAVRPEVEREMMLRRKRDAVDGLYERLAENYEITIDASPTSPDAASESAQ